MEQFSIRDAKTHLSKLLEKVANGEEIIIAKGRTPVAVLRKYEEPIKERQPGKLKGKIWIANEFGDELQEMFGIKA